MPARVNMFSFVAVAAVLSALGVLALHWRGGASMPVTRLPTAQFVPLVPSPAGHRGALRRPGLFALRMLLLAVLSAAALHALAPTEPGQGDARGGTAASASHSPAYPPRLALVLDASMSMQQRCGTHSAFALAQRDAKKAAHEALAAGAEIGLWLARARGASAAAVAFTRDEATVLAGIEAARPAAPRPTLAEAIRGAEAAGAGGGGAPDCLVFFDGASHALRPEERGHCRLRDVRPEALSGALNDAIVALDVQWPASAEQGAVAVARVQRTALGAAAGAGRRWLRLYAEGELVQRASLSLPADGEATWTVSWPAAAAGALVRVELEGDPADVLAHDDARTAFLPRYGAATLPALHSVAQQHEDPLAYVGRALARPPSGQMRVDLLPLEAVDEASTAYARAAWLLADVRGLAGPLATLTRGTGQSAAGRHGSLPPRALWQALGPNTAHADAHAPAPLVVGRLRDGRAPTWAPPTGRAIGQVAWHHPLLRDFAVAGRSSLMGAKTYAYWQLEPLAAADTVVLALDDGSPLLIAREARGEHGRRLLLTTTLSPAWTDLPLRAAYVPLVQRMAAWITGEAADARRCVEAGGRLGSADGGPSAGVSAGGAGGATAGGEMDAGSLQWRPPSGGAAIIASSPDVTLDEIGHFRAERWEGSAFRPAPQFDVLVQAPRAESALRGEKAGGAQPNMAPERRQADAGAREREGQRPYLLLLLAAVLVSLDSAVASSSPKKAARVGVVP